MREHAVEPLVRQPLAALEPREAAANTAPRPGLETPDGRSLVAGRMLAPAPKPRVSVTEGAPCVPAVGLAQGSVGQNCSRGIAVQEVAAATSSGLASPAPGGAARRGRARRGRAKMSHKSHQIVNLSSLARSCTYYRGPILEAPLAFCAGRVCWWCFAA